MFSLSPRRLDKGRVMEILSAFYGETKRIPLEMVDITSLTTIRSSWHIREEDVHDHVGGVLQGVMMIEAVAQSIVCAIVSCGLFPNHAPRLLGLEKFEVSREVSVGEKLDIFIVIPPFEGKKGGALALLSVDENKIGLIGDIRFRACKIGAQKRLGRLKRAA